MKFRDLLETKAYSLEEMVTKIIKNKWYAKNARVFDKAIYFEFKDTQGVLRLAKHFNNAYIDSDEAPLDTYGGGSLGYYELTEKAILDAEDGVAYYRIKFKDALPANLVKLAGAITEPESAIRKRAQEFNK